MLPARRYAWLKVFSRRQSCLKNVFDIYTVIRCLSISRQTLEAECVCSASRIENQGSYLSGILLVVVVDHGVVGVIVILAAVIAALRAALGLAGIEARAGLTALGLVHLLRDLVEDLLELLGGVLDGGGIGAGQRALEVLELGLGLALVGGIELVAHLAQGLLDPPWTCWRRR